METLDTDGLRAALRVVQRGPGVMTNYFFELLEASSFPVVRSEHSLVFLDLRATGWQVFRGEVAEMPLADDGGGVAGFFESLRQRTFFQR